ncbi:MULTISPECIES: nucleotidyltransferase domain-containing protein [Bacillota]|uniref:nucleotidyltransferase domain-containing protein n=1 Tax=Bacillota TaxID=1239 RepID=UPI0039EF9021
MKTVEGFENFLPGRLLNEVMNHIRNYLNASEDEFQPTLICIVGSRLKGTHSLGSDLDIAIQYKGDLREDDCFNSLMEHPLFIEGIKVDFISYSENEGNYIDLYKEPYVLLFELEEEVIEYNAEKMKRFIKQDKLLQFVFNDLTKRKVPNDDALKVIFNGYVLDDLSMIEEYKNV